MLALDHDVRLRHLIAAVTEGPGALPQTVRRLLVHLEAPPGPLAQFMQAMAESGKVSPDPIARLSDAGFTQDEVFEAAVCVALGVARQRLAAALAALEEVESWRRPRDTESMDMTTQKNLETVKDIAEAFGNGDLKGMLSRLNDDVEIVASQSAGVPWAGRYRGIADAERWLQRMDAAVAYESFEPLEYVAAGDKVVLVGRESWTSKATGTRCTQDFTVLFTLRDGKAARLQVFEDTAQVSAACGKKTN